MEEVQVPDLRENYDKNSSPSLANLSENPTTSSIPSSWNEAKAVWNYTKMTANAETIKNLTPNDLEKLEGIYSTIQAGQQRGLVSRGIHGAVFTLEQSLANLTSGNVFEETTQWVAATAGGLGIGAVGRTVGGAIGGAIGGPVGAALGRVVGGVGGGLIGAASTASYVGRKFEYSKFKKAGIEIEEPNAWQTIVDVVDNLPAIAVGGGLLSAMPHIYKIMNSAWKSRFNPENVKAKNKAKNDWLKEKGAWARDSERKPIKNIGKDDDPLLLGRELYSGQIGSEDRPPPGAPGFEDDALPGSEPKMGSGKSRKKRYTMQDTLAEPTPWNITRQPQPQTTQTTTGAPDKYDFDPNHPIKTIEEVADFVFNEHKKLMEPLDQTGREQYMFSTSVNVANAEGSFYKDYTDILTANLFKDGMDGEKLGVLFAEYMDHPTAQIDVVRHLYGEQVNFSKYHPSLGQFADNAKKYFQKSAQNTRKFGVPLQERIKYAPQKVDLHKVVKHGITEVIRDLMGWFDFKAAGHLTPQAQKMAVEGVYWSFLDQYSSPNLTYTGTGKMSTKPRVFIPKDAKSYMEFIKKYGKDDNIFESVGSHVFFTSRKHALINQFGTVPLHVFDKMIEMLPKPNSPASAARQQAIRNMRTKFFISGTEGFLANEWLTPKAISYYNALEGTLRNLLIKNNAQYEIIEAVLYMAFMQESYGFNTKTGSNMANAIKTAIENIKFQLGLEKWSDEDRKALADIALDYETFATMFPYKRGSGGSTDMPLGARKFNHMISKVRMTDTLSHFNRHKSGMQFQHNFGWEAHLGTKWDALQPMQRGLLEGGGINEKEWNYILDHPDDFLVDIGTLGQIFSLPQNRHTDGTNIHLLSYSKALNSTDSTHQSIGRKLSILQHEYVSHIDSKHNGVTSAAFLGGFEKDKTMIAHIFRNFFAFRGYAFDRFTRSMSKLDLEGHQPSTAKFASFAAQRIQIGIMLNLFRWGIVGRKPELESLEDVIKFLGDCATKGDLFPFSVLSELFADYYHTTGNNFARNVKQMARKSALGAGTNWGVEQVEHAVDLVKAAHDHDTKEAFYHARRLLPGANWLPTDFMINRVLFDNLAVSIDPEGAYALFAQEIRANNKAHFKHFVSPGDLTPIDAIGRSAVQSEYSAATADIKRAKKSGKEHPLAQARSEMYRNVAYFRSKISSNADPEQNEPWYNKINLAQKKYQLEQAIFYAENKPKSMSRRQVKKGLEKSIKEFQQAQSMVKT